MHGCAKGATDKAGAGNVACGGIGSKCGRYQALTCRKGLLLRSKHDLPVLHLKELRPWMGLELERGHWC
jgi:uncharacterized membrane protein